MNFCVFDIYALQFLYNMPTDGHIYVLFGKSPLVLIDVVHSVRMAGHSGTSKYRKSDMSMLGEIRFSINFKTGSFSGLSLSLSLFVYLCPIGKLMCWSRGICM